MSDMQFPYDRRARSLPQWLPDTQGFLAIAIVLVVAFVVVVLLVHPPSMDEQTRNILMLILGILLGCFKDVYQFNFGSSSGSKMLASVVAKSNESRDATIATLGTNLAASAPVAPIVTTTTTDAPAGMTKTVTEPAAPAAQPQA